MRTMDLKLLSEPFPAEDVEWRVSRAGVGPKGIYCFVLAYITARAIQRRLDDVVGPANWRLEPPQMLDVSGKSAFACGLSIRVGEEWVTKWDVCEPTNIEPAKGGWSGAMKRAGAQWGIGRYLYYLDETFAETTDAPVSPRSWNYARLSDKHGGGTYYWRAPELPSWALPKEPEHEITSDELNALKGGWKQTMAADLKTPKDLREGFARFVSATAGEFPSSDVACWTRDALDRCHVELSRWKESGGVSSDVPFSE